MGYSPMSMAQGLPVEAMGDVHSASKSSGLGQGQDDNEPDRDVN